MSVVRAVFLAALFSLFGLAGIASAKLPEDVVFQGKEIYQSLIQRGVRENWKALPVGERVARAGMALRGTPYQNFTLELDDRVETPSANFYGMDCWTFFEIALATARLLASSETYSPREFLKWIEKDRYRGGRCDGKFTSRLHHLEDWLRDNASRGLVEDVTPRLPGARKLYREMSYMGGSGSRFFRQLRADPSLVPVMARIERELSEQGIWYVPKSRVREAEPLLRNGDIVCIVTTWPKSYTSHVGLAVRDGQGILRFLHASRDARQVILDSRLSGYLARHRNHAGIMVARPLR